MPTEADPAPLPDSYHRAHRGYAAVAGLLLAWEFVGIKIQPPEATTFPATLNSPEAAPLVLSALVVYFGIKFTVEWRQSDAVRRARPVSLFDFALAHALGVVSVGLYAIQRLFTARLAEVIEPPVASGAVLALVGGLALSEIRRYVKEGQTDCLRMFLFVVAAAVPTIVAMVGQQTSAGMLAAGLALFAGFGAGQVLWLFRRRRSRHPRFG
jgi:hypothetical protein